MTDAEKLTLKAVEKVGEQVSDLSRNLTINTVKIEQLEETVSKLDEVVRTGNGHGSLVSRTKALEDGQKRAETDDGNVALARVKAGKEVWLALIVACGAAFASILSLLK